MNKNILKKVITLSLLGSTIFYSLNSLIPGGFDSLPKQKIGLPSKLDEADKLKLNKKLQPLGLGSNIRTYAATEINDEIVPGELMVKFKDLAQKESFVKENIGDSTLNTSLITQLSTTVTGDDSQDKKDTLDLVSQLKNDSRIAWAEPNLIAHKNLVPNDPKYNDQWALKNTGQPNLGYYNPFPTIVQPTPGFDIKAEQAWDVNTGNGTVIAIIDDGVDYTHPDLAPNILRDSGGRIVGKNIPENCFFSNSDGSDNAACNYRTIPLEPTYGHGTAVAGAAAAKGNNGTGISGACPNCKIMPIAVEGIAGSSTFNTTNIYNGMVYAINNNAKIINLSLGYGTFNQALSDLVDIAYSYDIVVVASSGNCGRAVNSPTSGCTSQNELEYPASYPKVISVSGTNPDGRKADFATVNSLVDVSGPANNIWTTWSQYTTSACGSSLVVSAGSTLCYEAGTSFSAPITAGIIGLILGQNPNYTAAQAETALKNGTTNSYVLNPSFVGLMGAGNVSACGALVGCNSNPASSSSVASLSSSSQSNTLAGSVNINFCQGYTGSTTIDLATSITTNNLGFVSQNVPLGVTYSNASNMNSLRLIYYPNIAVTANLGTIPGVYKLVVQESNSLGNVGAPIEYNMIFNVINCTSSSAQSSTVSTTAVQSSSLINSSLISPSSLTNSSTQVASSFANSSSSFSSTISVTMTQASSFANSTSVSSSSAANSSSINSSSVQSSSLVVPSSLVSSSSIQAVSSIANSTSSIANSSSTVSIAPSLGTYFPFAPINGTLPNPNPPISPYPTYGGRLPSFQTNNCTLNTGQSANITYYLTNGLSSTYSMTVNNSNGICFFYSPYQDISLPINAITGPSTALLKAPDYPDLIVPTNFTPYPQASSSSIPASSSLISSSQLSSSSIALPSVSITGVSLVGSQYQIDFVPTNYLPTLGGIHTHFYYNTEANTVMNKMYYQSTPYLLNISTKPANATQICAIVGNVDHSVVPNSGNCFTLPVVSVSSSSTSVSNSLVASLSQISSSVLSSANSSALVSSSRSSSSQILALSSLISSSTNNSSVTILTPNINGGGTITLSNNIASSSSKVQSSAGSSLSSFSSTIAPIYRQINESKTETSLELKDEFGKKTEAVKLSLEGQGECAKPIEAEVKNAKEQNIKDGNNVYLFGVINFKVKCEGSVKVKIFYPEVRDWKLWQVRKLIFDKDTLSYTWKNFESKLGFENNVAVVEYSITDGEYGDNTAKDGFIVDPIGLIQKVDLAKSVEKNKNPQTTLEQEAKDFLLPRTGGVNIINFTLIVVTIILVLAFVRNTNKKEQD